MNSQSSLDPVLQFYADCGVTEPLVVATEEVAAATGLQPVPETATLAAPAPADELDDTADGLLEPILDDDLMAARELARGAASLSILHQLMRDFDRCPLKAGAANTCVGEGPEEAPILFVGEAPGADEDRTGRPFVGRSGQLLERMIGALGLARRDVYITNILPWRPPANRPPTSLEAAMCEVFVRREIALVRPKVLVLLGGSPAKTLLQVDVGIMRQRGRWARYEDASGAGFACDAMATFHPAYLLRTPAEKRRVWSDLLTVKARLVEHHGARF